MVEINMEIQKIKDFFYYVGRSILSGKPEKVERNMALKKKLKNLDSEILKNSSEINKLDYISDNLKYANPRLN